MPLLINTLDCAFVRDLAKTLGLLNQNGEPFTPAVRFRKVLRKRHQRHCFILHNGVDPSEVFRKLEAYEKL